MITLKDKDEFFFHYNQKDYYDKTLYRAKVIGNSVELKWGIQNSTISFSIKEAMDAIDSGRWVVLEREEDKKEKVVETIQIEGVDHYFSKLENGEIIVFKMTGLNNPAPSYSIGYTTITQQEYDAIKKLIDLK